MKRSTAVDLKTIGIALLGAGASVALGTALAVAGLFVTGLWVGAVGGFGSLLAATALTNREFCEALESEREESRLLLEADEEVERYVRDLDRELS